MKVFKILPINKELRVINGIICELSLWHGEHAYQAGDIDWIKSRITAKFKELYKYYINWSQYNISFRFIIDKWEVIITPKKK